MTPEDAAKVLDKLVLELQNRQPEVESLLSGYSGKFSLQFASEDFRKFWNDRYSNFSDNWMQVVADAPHERLEVIGIRHEGADKGDSGLWNAWLRNEADYFSDLSMLDAIVAKRGFALVWGDDEDKAQITWEHPSQAIVAYDPETHARRYGAKVWVEDEFEYATLYARDWVYKFQRPRVTADDQTYEVKAPTAPVGGWRAREVEEEPWPLKNPLGVVPLVELPNKPRLIGEPLSDIGGVMAMQQAVNLLWSHLFTISDSETLPGRVVMGGERPKVPILNEAGDIIGSRDVDLKKMRHDRLLWLEDPNIKIGEWKSVDLAVWTKVIEDMVAHIAAQTRTPAHYLMAGGTFANISADAMKALETGLVMRTREKTQHFGRAIREIFRLVALVEAPEKAGSIALGTVQWRDVENRGDAQLVDALQKRRTLGYPLRYILELDGLPDPEIERVLAMVEEEQSDALLSNLLRPTAGTADAQVGA